MTTLVSSNPRWRGLSNAVTVVAEEIIGILAQAAEIKGREVAKRLDEFFRGDGDARTAYRAQLRYRSAAPCHSEGFALFDAVHDMRGFIPQLPACNNFHDA